MRSTLGPLAVIVLALGLAAPSSAVASRLALVVGSNQALDPDLEALRYADDDALRTADLLGLVSDDVRVLVRPDQETAALHEGLEWAEPTRDAVLSAIDDLVEEGERRADEGDSVTLYFVYSGHGNYDAEGRGYLHLEDGRLTLRDLFHHLVEPTEGVCEVILVIDACNAGFLVTARGVAKRRAAGPTTLRMEDYDHVGLILAASSVGEVREWGRYLSGIFSHQVRSGLMGGADLDGDGRILFTELAAFVAAANDAVVNPVYRLTPYIRAPLGAPDHAVIDYREARSHSRVKVDLEGARRLVVTDDDLVRYADLHVEEGFAPVVRLPRPGTWWFRIGDREFKVVARGDAELLLSAQPVSDRAHVSAKGVDSYLQRHLFEVPFGAGFAGEYLGGSYQESLIFTRRSLRPWYTDPWGWGAITTSLVTTSIATAFHVQALSAARAARSSDWADETDRYNRLVEQHNLTAGILYGIGGAAAVAGVLVFILDERWDTRRVVPSFDVGRTTVRPGLGGVWLERSF
ncbi:MAG: caspase family protein [Pseudomonadota bacterium]